MYFKAEDKYVSVFKQQGEHIKEYLIRTSLKDLLQQLNPEQFWQIHRSTVVNVSAIEKVRKNISGHMYVVIGSDKLAVSRSAQALFKSL